MLGDFTCRVALQVLGYLYPAYKTFKVVQLPATRSNDTLLRNWCQYWALMAVFTAVQPLVDTFCFWLPLYYEAKLGLAVYLWANDLAGSQHVWTRWFQPLVSRYEPVVDRRLAESKGMAREWLHSNTMRLAALAQAKALAWLAQVQAQAQAVAGGGAPPAPVPAPRERHAVGAAAATRGGARRRAASPDLVDLAASGEEEEGAAGESGEDQFEDEPAVTTRARRAQGGGRDKKSLATHPSEEAGVGAAAGVSGSGGSKAGEAELPGSPYLARFSSFSLASFYSARSSDLQAQDVKAGLKGFPVLLPSHKDQ